MPNTTFNTTQGSIALSGGNLIATGSGTGSTLGDGFRSAGKYYFEITYDVRVNINTAAGVGTADAVYSDFAVASITVFASGAILNNGTNTGKTLGALSNGDVICVAIDLDNKLIWFRKGAAGNWNGVASETPETIVGGVAFVRNFFAPYAQTGVSGDQLTLNAGDSAFVGAVPTGYTSGWPTGTSTQSVATTDAVEAWYATDGATGARTSATQGEAWVNFNTTTSITYATTALVEAWVRNESIPTAGIVTGILSEIWTAKNPAITNANTAGIVAEIWFETGSNRPPIPPGTILCATLPQDAEGDAGSPGTGMTDQLGGSFVPDNDPVDAAGDFVNDPPLTFQFSSETLACITAPANADGHDAGSTGTGITSLLVDTITPDVQPTDATGDFVTTNEGVSGQITSIINCTTTPTNAAADAGSSGTGITDQLNEALVCNNPPEDADGGTGVPPSSYSAQIP